MQLNATTKSKNDGFQTNVYSLLLIIDEFLNLALADMYSAVFSVMFVYVYLTIHLKSCFLSTCGISIIIFSFPFTVMVTEGIAGVTYFGTLQIIAVYIVLGIAADDIFVFYDAWLQSKNVAPDILNTK